MKLNIISKNSLAYLGFAILIVGIFFNLRLDQIFFSNPFGIHYVRQTDSLAFATHYYHNGFNFFDTGILNNDSVNGKAVCEFPIIYYITALLYTLFGEHLFILKLLNLIVIIFGLFSLFQLSVRLFNDYFYAFLVPLFLFTSTVFNYYVFNYF